jgi:hypothetical protein
MNKFLLVSAFLCISQIVCARSSEKGWGDLPHRHYQGTVYFLSDCCYISESSCDQPKRSKLSHSARSEQSCKTSARSAKFYAPE